MFSPSTAEPSVQGATARLTACVIHRLFPGRAATTTNPGSVNLTHAPLMLTHSLGQQGPAGSHSGVLGIQDTIQGCQVTLAHLAQVLQRGRRREVQRLGGRHQPVRLAGGLDSLHATCISRSSQGP